MRLFHGLLSLIVLAAVVPAQTPAQLKRELRQKEAAAKNDPDGLVEAGKWAQEHGLVRDANRILQNALKLAPDHKGANEALGNELVEGVWMTAKAAADARAKAREAEYKAKGMVEVSGVWVDKDQVDDAKRGVFHFDGQRVTRDAYARLTGDFVRHAITGNIIPRQDLGKSEERRFPIGDEGRWVDEKEADRFHADPDQPWVYRTHHTTIVGTAPIKKLEELRHHADTGYERVKPVIGTEPLPANRPVILVASTQDEFKDYGNAMGDETSAYGVFLAQDEVRVRTADGAEVRPVVTLLEKDWAPYYARHAAAIGCLAGVCAESGAEPPLWFVHGVGALASRFSNPGDAGWFGKQHAQKGGVRNVDAWFNSFAINGDMESKDIDYNVYQAGLVLAYAMEGGDDKVTAALQDVTAALAGGKAKDIDKRIDALRRAITKNEDAVKAYLQEVIRKGS